MTEHLRFILFPLGFLASALFALRSIVQWIQSEKKQESLASKDFWLLSLSGNSVFALHAMIQLQFPILFLQSLAALIALRNLDLMGKKWLSLKQAITLGISLLFVLTLLFFWQTNTWMRAPIKGGAPLPVLLHMIGFFGMSLFASRFWIQWWQAEREKKSTLHPSFWWMSLIGGGLSLFYFIQLRDPVNILSYGLGMLPYIRNLMLIKRRAFAFEGKNTLFMVAAETSADLLGCALLKELKEKMPTTRFVGVGGERMESVGFSVLIPSDQFEVMGLTALFPAALRLFLNFHRIKRHILVEKPKTILLIDYAEFNMLLAKALRKGGYTGKIVQYVIPSVWAWRQGRTKNLAKHYDLLLSILPFEGEYFKGKDVRVSFVGHPLVEVMDNFSKDPDWRKKHHLEKEKIFALFPGSRLHEIEANLPYQLKAAKQLLEKEKGGVVAISVAHERVRESIERILLKEDMAYQLIESSDRYQLMKEAHIALSTCGTVILELALLCTPTVVIYKISYLNYLVGRYLFKIKLPYFSLPNIIMQKELFPEHVDKKISYMKLLEMVERVLVKKEEILAGCIDIKVLLKRDKEASKEVYELFMS